MGGFSLWVAEALTATMSCVADAAAGIAEELLLPLGSKACSAGDVANAS